MRKLFKFIIIAVIVGGVGYWAYGKFFAEPSQQQQAGGPGSAPPVTVAEVIVRDVQEWQEFSGRLIAVDSAEVRPQVSGLIEKIHFKEGEWVEKGQQLFTIDQRPYKAALQAAEARATLAQSELARAKKLLAEKALPERDYDQRKNNAQVAQSELTRAKLDMDYTTVEAPVPGRVGRAEITVGNLVNAGAAPLLTTVVTDKPIYADFDIDEQTYLQYLQAVGSDADKVKAIPVLLGLANEEGATHPGTMQSFDNQLNIRSGTIRARTIYTNEDGKLIPGLYARIRLGSPNKTHAILITDRAIGTDQNKKFVLVVAPDGKTERREIKLGGIADNLRIVRDGLKPGEKIIISGMQRVMMPGMPVKPEPGNMEDKPETKQPPKDQAPKQESKEPSKEEPKEQAK